MYSISQTLTFILASNTVVCNSSLVMDDVVALLNSNTPGSMYQSTIYVSQGISVQSKSNSFSYCGATASGGVFTLSQTEMTDLDSIYQYCSGALGGVINCQEVNLTIAKSSFLHNSGSIGGVLSLQQYSAGFFDGVTFNSNEGYASAGVMYISTESYFTATNCDFKYNTANETSTIQVLGSSSTNNITLNYCTFQNNSATMNSISLMYSNVVIEYSQFVDNHASQRSKNIFCGFSTMLVHDSLFQSSYVQNATASVMNELTMGTYFFIIFDIVLTIDRCTFQNGLALQGGAIYISGQCSVFITHSNFYDNYARQYGGAIYGSGFNGLYVGQNTVFSNNRALELGDDFYVLNTESALTIDQIQIYNPYAITSLYAEIVTLEIMNSVFQDMNLNSASSQGAAIQCSDCRKINITGSTFKNMRSQLGGAIYISETAINKLATDSYGKYVILNSNFTNCISKTGGALYISNPQYLTINGTLFL